MTRIGDERQSHVASSMRLALRRRINWWFVVALVLTASACGNLDLDDAEAATGNLMMVTATEPATGLSELDGSVVSGTIHIVVEVNGNVHEVGIHLDDDPVPLVVDQSEPFELYLNTVELTDGPHVVSARVPSGRSGSTREIDRAEIIVSNSAGTPMPEDPEDPLAPPPDDPKDPVDPGDPIGADFFVAPWGSDAAPGTFEEPLFSLRRVAQLAQPGDTILLRGGVYDVMSEHVYLHIELNGTADAPITIKSYPGEMAVFDGHLHPWHPRYEGDGHGITDPYLVWVIGDHLVWEDITFRNGVGRGFAPFGNHNVIRRIVSHHHHATGVYLMGSYNIIEYVTSYDNNSVANGGNSANGIAVANILNLNRIETRGNIIRYSLVYRNSDDGIALWNPSDAVVEHNISFENGIGPTGNGMGFKLGSEEGHNSSAILRFNIAFKNANNFDTNGATGAVFYNNTAWASRSTDYVLTRHSTNACDNQAYNNISYQPAGHHVITGDCTIDENNSWNLNIDDPLFNSLDPTSPDFLSLSTHSPAINAGIDMGYPSAPDLGARQTNTHHPNLPLRDY